MKKVVYLNFLTKNIPIPTVKNIRAIDTPINSNVTGSLKLGK